MSDEGKTILAERREPHAWLRLVEFEGGAAVPWRYGSELWNADKGEWESLDRYRKLGNAKQLHARIEASRFTVTLDTILVGWPEGNGLQVRIYGMAEAENGDFALAGALNVEPTSWDVDIREEGDPIWEADGLTEGDALVVQERLMIRLPRAEEMSA